MKLKHLNAMCLDQKFFFSFCKLLYAYLKPLQNYSKYSHLRPNYYKLLLYLYDLYSFHKLLSKSLNISPNIILIYHIFKVSNRSLQDYCNLKQHRYEFLQKFSILFLNSFYEVSKNLLFSK